MKNKKCSKTPTSNCSPCWWIIRVDEEISQVSQALEGIIESWVLTIGVADHPGSFTISHAKNGAGEGGCIVPHPQEGIEVVGTGTRRHAGQLIFPVHGSHTDTWHPHATTLGAISHRLGQLRCRLPRDVLGGSLQQSLWNCCWTCCFTWQELGKSGSNMGYFGPATVLSHAVL